MATTLIGAPRGLQLIALVLVGCIPAASPASLTVLHSFDGMLGGGLPVSVVNGEGDWFWGTASAGGAGAFSEGALWRFNQTTNLFSIAHDFDLASEGASPSGGLVVLGGNLYGVNATGGAHDAGTLWTYSLETTNFSTLRSLSPSMDGSNPSSLLEYQGDLFGVSTLGGANDAGVIWRYAPAASTFTVLHEFTTAVEGAAPVALPVVRNGVLYGATSQGGSSGGGAIWSYDLNSQAFAVVHNFAAMTDGENPTAGLALAGSRLVGGTSNGGANNAGTIWKYDLATDDFEVLHHAASGETPRGTWALLGPEIYGVSDGGADESGFIWSLNFLTGSYSPLHSFGSSTEGAFPTGISWLGNRLGGTALTGGTSDAGTFWIYEGAPLPGDFDASGSVDAADYTTYRDQLGATVTIPGDKSPGSIGLDDYVTWVTGFSLGPASGMVVPEPTSDLLMSLFISLSSVVVTGVWHRRRFSRADSKRLAA